MTARRLILTLMLLTGAGAAAGQTLDTAGPVLFQADRIELDRERDLVVAEGNVELARGGRILRADRITFDRAAGVARAFGNVVLLEPGGGALFAERAELAGDLKDGFIEGFRARLGGHARLAANRAALQDGVRAELAQAVFSACEPCEEDPRRAPVWQVKARRVTHDRERRQITYRDAMLEMWGAPVLYLPWLRHPDPTVTRQSGFLPVSAGHDDDLGFRLATPWFWNIAPDRDATFTPILTSKRSVIGAGEYRQLFRNGRLELSGSLAELDERAGEDAGNGPRGHVRLQAEMHPDPVWRLRGQFHRTSDDGYLDLTGLDSSDRLRSFLEAEGFMTRSYLRAGLFDVQDLREGVSGDASPIAAPELLYEWREPPSPDGAWRARVGAAALHRRRGAENRRITTEIGWRREQVTPGGHRFELGADLGADAASGDGAAGGTRFRLLPRLDAGWRYPLAGSFGAAAVTVEPRVQVALARNDADADRFPNEDGRAVEFEFGNLFALDRFPGLDGADAGQRMDYGVEFGLHHPDGWHLEAGIGQSRRRKADRSAPAGSGLDSAWSDIVGRIALTAGRATSFSYRFRLDKNDLSARQTALDLDAGPEELRLHLRYARASEAAGGLAGRREQIDAGLESRLTEDWSAFLSHRRDLELDGALRYGLGARYADECFLFETTFERRFKTAGRKGDNRLLFRLSFRDFGGLRQP